MYKIKLSNISALFDEIKKTQALYIPVDNGDVCEFAAYTEGATVSEKLKTNRSAKDFFFPSVENLYKVIEDGKSLNIIDNRVKCCDYVIFGVRACDVRSFSILDRVFLADPVDTTYQERREHATIISIACNRPEETCFCQSFGIDAASPEGDVQGWYFGDELYLNPVTDKGNKLIDAVKSVLEECDDANVEASKAAIKTVMEKLPFAGMSFAHMRDTELLEHFNSGKWDELYQSCLGCGTCTYVCPTCQCYHIREFNNGKGIEKFKCWDSCMYSDFTKMAHGNPRPTQKERFRQRFMHKLVYFPDNNDEIFGCVGCGRCLQKCPVNMNIVKVAKALGGVE